MKIKVCGRPVEVRKALTRHQIETATKRRENQARRGTMERERYQREPGPGSHYGGYGDPRGRPGQFFYTFELFLKKYCISNAFY